MYCLWNKSGNFPAINDMKAIDGVRYHTVHTAIEGEYQFLLGAAIIKHGDTLRCSFGNSLRGENDANSRLSEKISLDGGQTWGDCKSISHSEELYGKSHGVYFEHNGELYAFCPRAKFSFLEYADLKMIAYKLCGDAWVELGIALDADFWPMCEPITLKSGRIIMAGLKTVGSQAAVAICDGSDITRWKMKAIPCPDGMKIWGETTVLSLDGRLLAIVRGEGENGPCLVSESFDEGEGWSLLTKTNLSIAQSKMYAGTLSNGENYLVFTLKDKKYRDTLCIAVGKTGLEHVYIIRHGFDASPRFQSLNEWCYPYAYEADGNLYIVYAKNKEDCELAIIPLNSLIQ